MEKHKLATLLRNRQHKLGVARKEIIDSISDDAIIGSYITCSCCGEKQVNEEELVTAIEESTSDDSFFDICDRFAALRSHVIKN